MCCQAASRGSPSSGARSSSIPHRTAAARTRGCSHEQRTRQGTGNHMSRPVIGVTVSEIRQKDHVQNVLNGEPPNTEMTLGLSYMRAVEMAGGLPVALPPLST